MNRWEIYWGSPQGSFYVSDEEESITQQVQNEIVSNIIDGAKLAGIQHAFVVYGDNPSNSNNNNNDNTSIENDNGYRKLIESKIPYTLIRTSAQSYVKSTPSYTFKSGIQQPNMSLSTTSVTKELQAICLEDLAAVCVQCIQSLDWTTSRTIYVSGGDDIDPTQEQQQQAVATTNNVRPDQQLCVNSYILRDKLANIQ